MLLAFVAIMVVGCKETGPIEITEVREIDPDNEMVQPVLASTSAERFRYRVRTDPAKEAEANGIVAPVEKPEGLTWETPEGWVEAPATSMRVANLRFGKNQEGECYFTILSGGGGGLAANVNRWRGQMGLEPAEEAAIEALPLRTLFGKPATYLSLDGTFSGMGAEPKDGYRMLGLISTDGGSTYFVKLTGPQELVAENQAKFEAFCASLKESK